MSDPSKIDRTGLLPCPFCGEIPVSEYLGNGGWYWIGCVNNNCKVECGVETKDGPAARKSRGQDVPQEVFDLLKEQWNTRN